MWLLAVMVGGQAAELSLDGTARWVDGARIEVAGARWALGEGVAFPIRTDAGEAAGFVFVGSGAASFAFTTPGEALAFATTLVTVGGAEPEVARSAITDSAWTEPFDLGFVVSLDPAVTTLIRSWPELIDDRGVVYLDDRGQEQVVVTGVRPSAARIRAGIALEQRVHRLAADGLDPRAAVAIDRHQPATARSIAEISTSRSWLPFLEPAHRTLQDRWLTFVADPTGTLDDRYDPVVVVHGLFDPSDLDPIARIRVLTGTPRSAPPVGARIERAVVNTIIEGTRGVAHEVRFEAVVVLRSEVPTEVVTLAIPREEDPAPLADFMIAGQFELLAVEVDGRPLDPIDAVFAPWEPPIGWNLGTWRLPGVLAPGEELKVVVRWRDEWPASRTDGQVELGRAAVGRAVVPVVVGRSPDFPAEIRVGTTLPGRWVAAVGSEERETTQIGDGRWVVSNTTGAARVSFGDLSEVFERAVLGFPAVRVLSIEPSEASPAFVRSVLNFYRGCLPPHPGGEITIIEAPRRIPTCEQRGRCVLFDPDDVSLREWLTGERIAEPISDLVQVDAVPGQILIRGFLASPDFILAAERAHPFAVERGIAHALAYQWWSGPAYGRRDEWIRPAAAAFFRDAFVREVLDPRDAAQWAKVRDQMFVNLLPGTELVPLRTGREPWTGDAGALLLAALAARFGEEQVLRGLDAFLRGEDPTTEGLAAALSATTGTDVGPFFDLWVTTGIRPTVTGDWRVVADGIRLTLRSDVPFGRFEVPVAVVTRSGPRTTWIELVDGAATVDLPVRGVPLRVEVDPDRLLPVRRPSVIRPEDPLSSRDSRDGHRY